MHDEVHEVDSIAHDFIQKFMPKEDITDSCGQVVIPRGRALQLALQCWEAIKNTVGTDIHGWHKTQIIECLAEQIEDTIDRAAEALHQAEAEERRNRPRGTKRNKVPIVCGDILEAPDRRMRGTKGTSGKVHCECTVLEILDGSMLRVRWGDGTESMINTASARRKQQEPKTEPPDDIEPR